MDRDALNSTPAHLVLEDAFLVLDAIQDLPPHRQVMGVVLLFKLLADRLSLDISELLDKAERMGRDADSRFHHHFRAICDYIDRELK